MTAPLDNHGAPPLSALAERSDAQLLAQFARNRDEAAFAELVRRHGPLVFGVCRRRLGNEHDAADAFQAVFLVLARKAGSIRSGEALGAWLYHVAYRTSLKARSVMLKRKSREGQVCVMPEPSVEGEPVDDVLEILDEEVRALPAKYQKPVILCELQGQSRKEVAALLNVPEGTLSSRLAAARKKLAERMRKRGVAVTALSLGAILAQGAASAKVPAALVTSTVKASTAPVATGAASAQALLLSNSVIAGMFVAKLQLLALLFLLPLLLATAVGWQLDLFGDGLDDRGRALAMLHRLGARLTWEGRGAVKELVVIDLKGTRVQDEHLPLLAAFPELRELRLTETAITDAAGLALAALPKLQTLRCNKTGLGDSSLSSLAELAYLKALSLGWTRVTDAGMKELADRSELRELDLRSTRVTDRVLRHLRPCRHLAILDVSKTDVTDDGLAELLVFPELTTLRLSETHVTDVGLATLARLTTLASLALEKDAVTDAGLVHLAALRALEVLDVSGTGVTDAGIPTLAGFPSLHHLALEHTNVTGAGFEAPQAFQVLERLALSGTKVTDATLPHVASRTTLRSLSLDHTAVSDTGVEILTALPLLNGVSLAKTSVTDACLVPLGTMRSLSSLKLSETDVTDAGLRYLADRVRTQQGFLQLRNLTLHKTALTDAATKLLATLRNLDSLAVSWTKITDAGLSDLAQLRGLRVLRLGGCQVTDAGLPALAPLVNLRTLGLDWTQVTDDGLRELAGMLVLEELQVEGSAITEEGLQELTDLKRRHKADAPMTRAAEGVIRTLQLDRPAGDQAGESRKHARPADGAVRVLRGHTGPVHDLRFTPDGRKLISASGWPGNDYSVRIWDLESGRELHRILAPGQASCLELTHDGKSVLVGAMGGLLLIDLDTGHIARRFKGPSTPVNSVTFSADGKFVYSASLDGVVRRWAVDDAREVDRFRVNGKWARYAAELPDGKVVTGDSARLLQIWDPVTGREVQRIPTKNGWLSSARLMPGGKQILIGGHGIYLWDLTSGLQVQTYLGHSGDVSQMTLSPDGKTLLTASMDGTVRLWDIETGEPIRVLASQDEFVFSAVFSPDGRRIATGGGGRKEDKNYLPGTNHDIRLWDLATEPVVASESSPPVRFWKWIGVIAAVVISASLGLLVYRRRADRS